MDIDISQYPATVEAFGGNEQRAKVFLDRYAKKDASGKPVERTPEEMWGRVAAAIAEKDGEGIPVAGSYNKFFGLLKDFKFVPGGRILSGAGAESEVTFYNCYVIPVETKARRGNRELVRQNPQAPDDALLHLGEYDRGSDSREAIFDTIGLMVDIMSRGGGVGINWSVLRPKGAYLKRVNGTTSGPVSWMDVASRAVGVVEQGGSRRGAAMFMLDDWHPDVLEFIDAKRDFSLITNANVSVAVSDDFMLAVENDTLWSFCFPDTSHEAYDSEWDGDLDAWYAKGYPVVEYGSMAARDVWRKLAEAAHASGEPGVVFLDRYNKLSTARYGEEGIIPVERIISVNPCGEQGLGPYSVCNLGAMNLAAYAHEASHTARQFGSKYVEREESAYFDYAAFWDDVITAVEFLDRVIDTNYYFLPENESIQKQLRRIGLGVMGLADALIKLGYRYGSPEAVEFTEAVFREMKYAAVSASANLARDKGPAPAWHGDMALHAPYLKDLPTEIKDDVYAFGLRNLFLLTQAPTGTTSILAGVNSGIEPYFAFEYTRKDRTGTHKVYAPILSEWEKAHNGGPNKTAVPDYFVTSAGVSVEEHIAMQAAVQKYVDSSVSKTINGPNSHTVEDVEKAYTLAYESGLKGLAYFRDGSGRAQVLYKEEPKQNQSAYTDEFVDNLIDEVEQLRELVPYATEFRRGPVLTGRTMKVRTSNGTAYVTVNEDGAGRPVEIFVNVGKAGSDVMELGEAIGRVASLALRHGATLGGVANQLEGIGGNGKFNPPLAHAIGQALTQINSLQEPHDEVVEFVGFDPGSPDGDKSVVLVRMGQEITGSLCPDCSNLSVVLEEGCQKCHICGWSAC